MYNLGCLKQEHSPFISFCACLRLPVRRWASGASSASAKYQICDNTSTFFTLNPDTLVTGGRRTQNTRWQELRLIELPLVLANAKHTAASLSFNRQPPKQAWLSPGAMMSSKPFDSRPFMTRPQCDAALLWVSPSNEGVILMFGHLVACSWMPATGSNPAGR